MRAKLGSVALSGCLLLATLTACGGPSGEGPADEGPAGEASNEESEAQIDAVADAEWAWLKRARQALEVRRRELAHAEAEVRKSGKDPAADPAVQTLARDVRTRTDELRRRLLGFINDHPPAAGEAPSGRTLEAIRMKSDEDILIAAEHMNEGGDYRTAIDIYEAALAVDPDNPRLKEELGKAHARRYMTRERFAQVQDGMSADQVRALLGPPNVHDVREYPVRGVTAWFYARDARGGAAAVWFEKKAERLVVYEADFDALPAPPPPPPG